MIEVIGRLLRYTRLDNAISTFEAIWKRNAAREKGKKQEGDQRRVETNHVIPSSDSSCMHAYGDLRRVATINETIVGAVSKCVQ